MVRVCRNTTKHKENCETSKQTIVRVCTVHDSSCPADAWPDNFSISDGSSLPLLCNSAERWILTLLCCGSPLYYSAVLDPCTLLWILYFTLLLCCGLSLPLLKYCGFFLPLLYPAVDSSAMYSAAVSYSSILYSAAIVNNSSIPMHCRKLCCTMICVDRW